MEGLNTSSHLNVALAIVFLLLFMQVHGQITTSCTGSILHSFSSCTNFLTDGSGSSPTADCCDSLKSLMSSGRDCLCLIITGPTDDDPESPSWLPDPNAPPLTPPGEGCGGTLTPPGLTPDTPEGNGFPTMTPPGVRPDLSSAQVSRNVQQLLLLALFGAIAFIFY